MARPRLTSARSTAAKNVASKLAGNSKAKATTATVEKPVGNAIAYSQAVNTATPAAFVVPGLPTHITPDAVVGMMPKFDESAYQIIDPLNPPETLPQATEAQFDKGMTIYEGTQRALKLTGAAFDTTRERFTTLGKQAKAFGAGVKAATEFERVKGDFIDYQGSTPDQRTEGNQLRSCPTQDRRQIAPLPLTPRPSMDEKLKQAEIAAELARATTQDKQISLMSSVSH
jgi:hypothetical protein